jgi:hypothetical protein
MDPTGEIIQTNVPSGVFGHFLGWASLDWLGNSAFSQGGGFFPVKNKDDTSTVLYVPINQTGTYTLLTHSTLFGGSSITEPITLAAKFTNISSEMNTNAEKQDDVEIELIPASSEENPKSLSEAKPMPETQSIPEGVANPIFDLPFGTGIAIGIVIGIMIGIAIILIMRQKLPNN